MSTDMRLGFLVLAMGLLACGGDGSSDSNASSASGGASGSGGSGAEAGSGGAGGNSATGGTGGTPTSCQDLGGETPADAVCVLEITGEVVDEAGAPVADRELSLCGPVCFFATSREDGSFSIPVGYDLPLRDYSTLLHGRPFNVSFYYQAPVGAPGPVVDVGTLREIPFAGEAPTLVIKNDLMGAAPPAQSVTSNGVTLEVEAGVQIELDIEDVIAEAEGRKLRVQPVSGAFLSETVGDGYDFNVVFAFGPFEMSFSRPGPPKEAATAKVTFPNTTGLAAATPVEFWALGTYLYPDWVKPAAFEKVADGQVSADGSTIALADGQGLQYLTWIGIKEAQ